MIYNSLSELIKAVRNHTASGENHVAISDDPQNLMFRYFCEKTQTEFKIKISSVKTETKLFKYFSTREGKIEFLDYLNWKKLKL